MTGRIRIVGIGDDGAASLTGQARQAIESADVLLAPRPLLEKIDFGPSDRRPIGSDLDHVGGLLQALGDAAAVMLVSGDPLFYGIVRFLADAVGKERLEVIPHVSSMQLAFARVKENWDDAYLANLATQPLDRVVETIRSAENVGLFTTEEITPGLIATALLDRRIDYFTAYVCENLGSPDERVTQADLPTIAATHFGPLNVMVLIRHRGAADRPRAAATLRRFGNPDECFLQSRPKRGLLTPMEVRCIALAELDLTATSIVWDVGAGSGSLAIEAARLADRGQVYAIEMDAEDFGLMVENAAMIACPLLVPIHGQAPEAWSDLPDPDAIFVGGGGRSVAEVIGPACARLRSGGRIVVNVSSPQNLAAAEQALRRAELAPQVRMISICRGIESLGDLRFEAAPPSFLLVASRG